MNPRLIGIRLNYPRHHQNHPDTKNHNKNKSILDMTTSYGC